MRQRLPGRAPLPQPQLAHAHPLAGPPAFKRYEDGLLATVLFVVWGFVLHGFPGGVASALVAACAGITLMSLYERQKWGRVLARARAERDQPAGSVPS